MRKTSSDPAGDCAQAASEERYRLLVENANAGIWSLDGNHRTTYANPVMARMLGYTIEEMLGQPLENFIFAEDMEKHAQRMKARHAGTDEVYERRFKRKDAELELVKLRRCVEKSSAAILITDRRGVIEYINPAFTEMTGYTREEAIGRHTRIMKSGIHNDCFYRDMWQTIAAGHTWRGEICNRRKNGELCWEQASISSVKDEQGVITNYIAVKDDISDKKDLERIKEDVERIMRHDLKTPLNAIMGMPQLLEMQGNLTAEQLELVRAIQDSGKRMLYMIDSSLGLFKMETGEYEYAPQRVDALAVIAQLGEHVRSKLSAKNLSLRVTVDGEPPSPGQAFALASEERLLYTLFSNLLLNAIEASPQGEAIVMELAGAGPRRIAIRNIGVVPPEVRGRFFEKYKTHGKKSGTGLGTYSAKLHAETMRYGLHMDTSDQENTTCITISVPEAP